MNLFRSEEHLTRWLHHWHTAGDYVLPVGEWSRVFSAPTFRRRLDPDYLARSGEYLDEYRRALRAAGKSLPAPDRILSTVLFTDVVDSTRHARYWVEAFNGVVMRMALLSLVLGATE